MEGESRSDERVMQVVWEGAFHELLKYFLESHCKQ